MTITPQELFDKVTEVVNDGEQYNQALMYETLGVRWGEEQLAEAVETTITLNQPYSAGVTDYVIWRQVRTSDGTDIDVVVVPGSKTNTSFRVWAPMASTFTYLTTRPIAP